MNTLQYKMASPIGPLYLVASALGIQGLFWDKQPMALAAHLRGRQPLTEMLARAVRQLEEYFQGQRTEFDLPLDIQGTPFQKRVWAELSKIPYGETVSYKEVARRIRNRGAMRAVGTANGRNPVSIIVPCHRVIAADGSLGGYGGGLRIKTQLLKLEGAAIQACSPPPL